MDKKEIEQLGDDLMHGFFERLGIPKHGSSGTFEQALEVYFAMKVFEQVMTAFAVVQNIERVPLILQCLTDVTQLTVERVKKNG